MASGVQSEMQLAVAQEIGLM